MQPIVKVITTIPSDDIGPGFDKVNNALDYLITGATFNNGVLSLEKLDGSNISVAVSGGNTSGITFTDFYTYTASTETKINNKLDVIAFNNYSSSTLNNINDKLNKNEFNNYSSNTLSLINNNLDLKLDKTTFYNYTANTSNRFTSDIPVILSGGKTMGRYTNGQTIPAIGKTAQEVFLDIAQEFISPSIGFNITSGTIKEKGVAVTSVSMNYSTTPNSATVSLRKLLKNSTVINNPVSNGGSFTHNSQNIIFSDSVGDRTYSYQVDYSNFTTQTINNTINFYPPSFFGVGGSNLLSGITTTSGLESSLPSSKELRTSRSRGATVFNPINNRYFFVYPASFGNLSSIIDQNGFNITAGFTLTTQIITLADGITNETYNIYMSNSNTTQTNFFITFN